MYPGMLTIRNGVPEANIVDIVRLCQNTMFYMAFVILLFGPALLLHLPSEQAGLSDDKKEKIEEIKSRLKEKNRLK